MERGIIGAVRWTTSRASNIQNLLAQLWRARSITRTSPHRRTRRAPQLHQRRVFARSVINFIERAIPTAIRTSATPDGFRFAPIDPYGNDSFKEGSPSTQLGAHSRPACSGLSSETRRQAVRSIGVSAGIQETAVRQILPRRGTPPSIARGARRRLARRRLDVGGVPVARRSLCDSGQPAGGGRPRTSGRIRYVAITAQAPRRHRHRCVSNRTFNRRVDASRTRRAAQGTVAPTLSQFDPVHRYHRLSVPKT